MENITSITSALRKAAGLLQAEYDNGNRSSAVSVFDVIAVLKFVADEAEADA